MIYLCLAHMSGREQEYIQQAFDTNWVTPLGPNVNAFEQELKSTLHIDENKSVLALSAGTAAIHLALVALDIKPEDEVIVQTFTFCASVNPVLYMGAKPIFVDSEEQSWNMDPVLLEQAIKDRIALTNKKPKAIIPVCLYGMPLNYDEIMRVANRYDIPVVEDAAEAFGSSYDGKMCGAFGKLGVLSFNGNKMITTSGGGALICENEDVKKRLLYFATQARENYPYYHHTEVGYNYRLSNICAGIGRGQLFVADEHIEYHRHLHEIYVRELGKIEGVEVHSNPTPKHNSNYWLTTITLSNDIRIKGEENLPPKEDGAPNNNVEALRRALLDAQIESRPLWKPLHLHPLYKDYPQYINGVSQALFEKGLCLPSGPCVTEEDIQYIITKIKEFILNR